MLRLVFHDAATFDERAGDGGADASVFYELSRPENKGLKRGCSPPASALILCTYNDVFLVLLTIQLSYGTVFIFTCPPDPAT